MEPIDNASQQFKKLVAEITEGNYWASVQSEADTRMKVIDRVFVEILGWPRSNIHLESAAGPKFIDYRCTIDNLNRLIIEAKRELRDLGINDDHTGRFFKLNGAVFNTEAAREGIEQAIRYCGHKNAELACVTNGRQWVIFRGARGGDGTETLDGYACVFGSLNAIANKFSLFYELLGKEHVHSFAYRAHFHAAEGQPIRRVSRTSVARQPDSRVLIPSDQISNDLDRIMLSFFRDLTGKDDAEARRACFVSTTESNAAEQKLARLSDELRNAVRSLRKDEGGEIEEAIRRVAEMNRHELILLVGTKGAGKSTFVDRFFSDVLSPQIRADCVVVRVDLSASGCDSTTIIRWLDQHFLEALEIAAFPDGPPTYDELQGMFFTEYRRWSEGHAKHLYTKDKDQFKIEFGRHIEQFRRDRPHNYIERLLFRIVHAHGKVPCLVFDNADHFDVPFQEEVFKYAHALHTQAIALVIVPITDTTSWQLAKQGPLQSFFTESYFLPTPPTELVLRRRIEFIERQLASGKGEQGKGYFLARGIPLEIDDIKRFAACLQAVFLNTGQVSNWIGSLANHDIRRSLQLTREIVASPHIRVTDLLKAYVTKTVLQVNVENVKLAIMRGKYDIYHPTTHSFVQNVFNLTQGIDTSPLIPIRILSVLEGAWDKNADNDNRFVLVTDLVGYCQTMNIEPRATLASIDSLLKLGLCLGYDPTRHGLEGTSKVELSPSGRQHLNWAKSDWVYLESMAEITPLYDDQAAETIKNALASQLLIRA